MGTEPKLRDAWSTGSYADVATHYLPMAARLVDRSGVESSDRVLDIGCGTGNVAITAARQGARVTGIDVTPELLETARENAELADVERVDWSEGDATNLPFENDRFDATLSCLGHIYGDPPSAAARELLRVTRPGGRIGFVSWTPTGLFPFMASVLASYLPADALPEFSEPPFMWGDSGVVTDRLDERVEDLAFESRTATYPTLSPAHFWEEMATTSGVFLEFLDAVAADERRALREEMIETIGTYFLEGENAVELEYALATARLPRASNE